TCATIHNWLPGVVLYPMTDIGGGIFSLVFTAVFLNFWKPKKDWHFDTPALVQAAVANAPAACDPHAAGAAALIAAESTSTTHDTKKLPAGNITLAWMPYVVMSILLMLTGLVRQKETPVSAGPGPVKI